MSTLVHLIRHGRVENPDNVWYGRLEGFHISERGRRQAKEVAEFFAERDLVAIYSSPLTRALQTAEVIAEYHDLEVIEEPGIIESETKLEGQPGDLRLFRNLLRIRHFLNPFLPSWGEPFASIRGRMVEAIDTMRQQHRGHEVVAVSHMTPILVARLAYEERRVPPWMSRLPCGTASVTTLEFDGPHFEASTYRDIGGSIS